jgi:acetyl esterase
MGTEYAIHPELAPWISMLPEIDLSDVEEARRRSSLLVEHSPEYEPRTPIRKKDLVVPGPAGSPGVAIRTYTPEQHLGEAIPGLVFFHGGGYVTGSVAMFDNDCVRLADSVGIVVVSVDYRLAPEYPFPAGLEDCYAAVRWTAENADELGLDPARLGVGGESAGGGLAAAVSLLARDRGGPGLCFQWLDIPEIDDRLDTPSMISFTDTPNWTRRDAELSWGYYLGSASGPSEVSPYAAPARAVDLAGLPRAYVSVSEFDPLRDEGFIYAHRLIQAGVPTELSHYPGTFHGSQLVNASISHRMMADVVDALRRGLSAEQVVRAAARTMAAEP